MPRNAQRSLPPVPAGAVFITAAQVCGRYGGRSHMWLERKIKRDPNFPRPTKMGGLRLFRVSELEVYERACASRPHDEKSVGGTVA